MSQTIPAKRNPRSFTVCLRKPAVTSTTASTITTTTTTTISKATTARKKDAVPSGQRRTKLDELLKTPPLPQPVSSSWKEPKPFVTDDVIPTSERVTAPTVNNITDNLTTDRQVTLTGTKQFATTLNSIHLQTFELEKLENHLQVIESTGLVQKLRNFRLAMLDEEEDEEEVNDENAKPATESKLPDRKSALDLESSEFVAPKGSSRKIVRAFSADQSVVEVLPETGDAKFEPSFIKSINNDVLRLPNSHRKVFYGNGKTYSPEINAALESLSFLRKGSSNSSANKASKPRSRLVY